MSATRSALLIAAAFYAVLWIGGVVSYLAWGEPPSDARWTAPAFLFLATAIVFLQAAPRTRVWLLVALLAGLAIEIIGAHTGFPFGRYRYTGALSPLVFGVPPVIAGSWVVLALYVKSLLSATGIGTRWRLSAGAAWMTAIDAVIDPLAAGPLRYWRWQNPGPYHGVPWTNFAGWLVTAAVILAILEKTAESGSAARWVGTSILVFFAVVALGTGLPLPGLIACGLVGLQVLLTKPGPARPTWP
jgi:putative membrane protein